MAEDPQAARPLQLAAAIAPDPLVKCSAEVVATEPARRRRVGEGRALALAGPAARCRHGEPDPGVHRAGRPGDLLPAQEPRPARVPGRPLDVLDRASPESSPSRTGEATRTCSPRPRAAGRCRWGSSRSAGIAGSRGELTPLATLRGGAPCSAGSRPVAGAPTSARPRRPSAIRRWPPTASCSTCWCSGRWPAGRGAGKHPAADGRRARPAKIPPAGSGWPGPKRRSRPITPLHRGVYRSGDRLLAVNRAAAEDSAPVLADDRRGRAVPRARLRPGRRPGRQPQLVDPGDLAAVPGRDDGGDGGRGGPLPAQARAPAGGHVMSVSRSLTFLWTPWSLALSVVAGRWSRPGSASSPGGGAAIDRSMGMLELLRLALVAIVGRPAQPAGVDRGIPPRGEAVDRRALGRLAQHGDARRRRRRGKPRPRPTTRREAIAPLADPATWDRAAGADERRDPAVLAEPQAGHGGPTCTSRSPRRPRRSRTCAAIVLASDGDWNEGQPPVQAAARLRIKGVPVFAVPVGSPTRLPDIELLSLDLPDVRRGRQVGADPVHDRKLAAARVSSRPSRCAPPTATRCPRRSHRADEPHQRLARLEAASRPATSR